MAEIRDARPEDAAAIARIIGHEVIQGVAHFSTRAPTPERVARDIASAPPHPFLVLIVDGAVVGYARSSPWKPRQAYDWTAEIGIYLDRAHTGKGLGRELILTLIDALQKAGFRTLLGGIALPNPASVGLVESVGFRPIGVLDRVGYKHGAWRDVGYWTLHLGQGAPVSRPPPSIRTLPFVQVDAFASRPFEGNPAAVMRLPEWLDDATLQRIARENNLSETAFVVDEEHGPHLRWFTPTVEVDLCGHATLAAGFAILGEDGGDSVTFHTRSGPLTVSRARDGLAMELPSHPPGAPGLPPGVIDALGAAPDEGFAIKALHHADYWLAVFGDAAAIAALEPDIAALASLRSNVICTAPGDGDLDFVSRFFAPGSGVPEDPVTGSAHATLTPFWADRLGKNPLAARQISPRGGSMTCELRGDRVVLTASCVEVIRGTMSVSED